MSRRPQQWVARLDAAADALFDPIRGRRPADRVFEVASHLGDWSLIWLIATTAIALRSEDDLQRAPRVAAILLTESVIVNQGVKRLFKRARPLERPVISDRLRVPRTTSFPSGHASAAACASVLLTDGDPALRAVVVPLGLLVATSRIHTRMHHPSDVVAGAALGWAFGRMALSVWPMPPRSST